MEENFSLAVGFSPLCGVCRGVGRTDILGNRMGPRFRIYLCSASCFFHNFTFDPPNFAPFPIRATGILSDTGFFMHFIDFYLIYRYNNIS